MRRFVAIGTIQFLCLAFLGGCATSYIDVHIENQAGDPIEGVKVRAGYPRMMDFLGQKIGHDRTNAHGVATAPIEDNPADSVEYGYRIIASLKMPSGDRWKALSDEISTYPTEWIFVEADPSRTEHPEWGYSVEVDNSEPRPRVWIRVRNASAPYEPRP